MITIVICVKEDPKVIDQFIEGNKKLLEKYPVIVIDKKGGDQLKKYASSYEKSDLPLNEARRKAILMVNTELTLILDADVILPKGYISKALELLKDEETVVVSIEYDRCVGHLPFGTSLWKTKWLKELYDWSGRGCECLLMWARVHSQKKRIETCCYRAKHLAGSHNFARIFDIIAREKQAEAKENAKG